jgi:predicted nuclease of predicted toxin-antitoxin system
MRFLVDECTGPSVAKWLREQGHDVFSVYDQARGDDDDAVMKRAISENRILITNDKDFGEKVYRDKRIHSGIVLLRLQDESFTGKITALEGLLRFHTNRLEGSFVVVTDNQVRLARLGS